MGKDELERERESLLSPQLLDAASDKSINEHETDRVFTGRLTPFLAFACALAVIGPFEYGYQAGVMNSPQEVIRNCTEIAQPDDYKLPPCFSIDSGTWGLLVGLFSIGGLIGGVLGGPMVDRYGRRMSMFGANLFFLSGGLCVGIAPSVAVLGIGRALGGIGAGISTVVVPMFLSEISPSNLRGAIGVLNQLSLTFGILVAQVLGLFMSSVPLWRWLLAAGAFLNVLQCLLLPFCPETPRFLLLKRQSAQAERVLRRLRGTSEVAAELSAMTPSAASTEDNSYTAWQLLRDKTYRRPLIIAIVLQLTQQLSGINAVFYYSTAILEASFPDTADVLTVSIGALNVVLTILSVFLMDRAGRRKLLIIGEVGMIIFAALIVLSLEKSIVWLQITCIYLFVASFAVGLGPIPFLIVAEIFPTNVVGAAASISITFNWACNYAIAQLFPIMDESLGSYSFLPFAIYLMGALIFTLRYVPETKGRELDEIVRSLRS